MENAPEILISPHDIVRAEANKYGVELPADLIELAVEKLFFERAPILDIKDEQQFLEAVKTIGRRVPDDFSDYVRNTIRDNLGTWLRNMGLIQ